MTSSINTPPDVLKHLSPDEILFLFIKKVEMFANDNLYKLAVDTWEKLDLYAYSVFKNQLYSNINVQDAQGNTFLHYAVQSHSWHMARLLLVEGANPYLKNKDGIDAFNENNSSSIDYFKKNHLNFEFNDRFASTVNLMPPDLKQFCFERSMRERKSSFESIDLLQIELLKCNLYNKDNFLKAIVNNDNIDKSLRYLLEHLNNEKDNSFTLQYALSKTHPQDHTEMLKVFVHRPFIFDAIFETVLYNLHLRAPSPLAKECFKIMFSIIVNNSMHITHPERISYYVDKSSPEMKDYFNSLKEKFDLEKGISSNTSSPSIAAIKI